MIFDRHYGRSEYCSVQQAELVCDSEDKLYFCHQLPREWNDYGSWTLSRRRVIVKLDSDGNYIWYAALPGGPALEPVLSRQGRLIIYTSEGKLVAVR